MSCVWKYPELRWREPASKFCQCCSAFRPLLVVEPFNWHYLNCLFASSYQAWTVASHLYYMTGCLPKHVVTIHSNYFDTGLAAASTENSLGNVQAKTSWDRESKDSSRAVSSAELSMLSSSPVQLDTFKYFGCGQDAPCFLTPADFPPSLFARVLSTTLCQCIPSTYCLTLN